MKVIIIATAIALAACTSQPPPLPKPPSDAQVWDLNPGRWPGTNDLVHEPSLTAEMP